MPRGRGRSPGPRGEPSAAPSIERHLFLASSSVNYLVIWYMTPPRLISARGAKSGDAQRWKPPSAGVQHQARSAKPWGCVDGAPHQAARADRAPACKPAASTHSPLPPTRTSQRTPTTPRRGHRRRPAAPEPVAGSPHAPRRPGAPQDTGAGAPPERRARALPMACPVRPRGKGVDA